MCNFAVFCLFPYDCVSTAAHRSLPDTVSSTWNSHRFHFDAHSRGDCFAVCTPCRILLLLFYLRCSVFCCMHFCIISLDCSVCSICWLTLTINLLFCNTYASTRQRIDVISALLFRTWFFLLSPSRCSRLRSRCGSSEDFCRFYLLLSNFLFEQQSRSMCHKCRMFRHNRSIQNV